MSSEAPPPVFLGVALAAALLMALAVLRWGRRGAVLGYALGLAACILAWMSAVFMTGRLDGAGPAPLLPALGRSLAAIAVLASLWLAVGSAGAVAGALGRLLHRRLRRRRLRAPKRPSSRPPAPDRTRRRGR